MREETELEYERMKEFFLFFAERYLNVEGLPAKKNPIDCLEALEKKTKNIAFIGLRQAVNDCVEMSHRFDHAEVEKLDSQLRSLGIVTLSELRRQFSKIYAGIIKRRKIKDDTEYYLIRNILGDSADKTCEEIELLEKMLSEYDGS